jgi:ribosome-associated protein
MGSAPRKQPPKPHLPSAGPAVSRRVKNGERSPSAGRYRTDRYTLERSVIVTTYRSSRPGGQKRDKTETGVRLAHRPSGVVVTASERRSQARNREVAFERLKARLEKLNERPKRRRPTKRPRSAEERRLADKARTSRRKQQRKVGPEDY